MRGGPDVGAMSLAQAGSIFRQVLGLKQTYQAIVNQNPGVEQGSWATNSEAGKALASIAAQAASLRAQLTAGGYAEAASVLASDDYSSAAAWAAANPDLGGEAPSGSGSATPVATSGSGAAGNGPTGSNNLQLAYSTSGGGGSNATTGTSGILGTSLGFLNGIGSDVQGIIGALLHPGTYVANLGAGVQTAEADVGQGITTGGTAANAGLTSLWSALVWPFVIVASLIALDRISKKRRR